jgi:two-component system LytT family response regulator
MGFYESVLDNNKFVRIHRSYILNIQELTRIEPLAKDSYLALLKNGTKIPLSQTGYTKLKGVLGI